MKIHNPYQYFKDNLYVPESVVPQNIVNVIKELGENSVVFFLFLLTRNTKWKVYRNLTEKGCDIVLVKGHKLVKIEVKTRQNIHSTNKNKKRSDRTVQFALSKLEYESCDLVIGFWFNRNAYFVLEKSQLVPSTVDENSFRIVLEENEDGKFHYGKKNSRIEAKPNNWEVLASRLT